MKRDRIIYWIATGLVSGGMLSSAYLYLSKDPRIVDGFATLELPVYFVTILGAAKLLGAIALVVPIWERVKEWAYAGFLFTFIGAVWTHLATGTPWVAPAMFLAGLGVSYYFWLRIKAA